MGRRVAAAGGNQLTVAEDADGNRRTLTARTGCGLARGLADPGVPAATECPTDTDTDTGAGVADAEVAPTNEIAETTASPAVSPVAEMLACNLVGDWRGGTTTARSAVI
ncbi:MAG TPA: hypothetical protein PLB21_00265 [Actinomycetota bacterium]|nr:hypothetical protein [Actinomycetota bacterium]